MQKVNVNFEPFHRLSTDRRPHIKIRIDGHDETALTDTGAMVSIIGYVSESDLSKYSEIFPSRIIITTIDKSEHEARGKILARVQFNGMTAVQPFILVKTPAPQIIAGYDFCENFGIKLSIDPQIQQQLSSEIAATAMHCAANHLRAMETVRSNEADLVSSPPQRYYIGSIELPQRTLPKQIIFAETTPIVKSHNVTADQINVSNEHFASSLPTDSTKSTDSIERLEATKFAEPITTNHSIKSANGANDIDDEGEEFSECLSEGEFPTTASTPNTTLRWQSICSLVTSTINKCKQQLLASTSIQPALSQLISTDTVAHVQTSNGAQDTETDILPAKHECVTEPHHLTPQQQRKLENVLENMPYTPDSGPLNCTSEYVQDIRTGDAPPEIRKQYPLSPAVQIEVKAEIKKMLERDIIRKIEWSPWRWPILWVKKQGGGGRICVDARGLNKLAVADAYPSLNVDSILRNLPSAKYITAIDMTQAFHQIPIREDHQIKTSFAIGNEMYCYKRAIMGYKNSPADLTKLLDKLFSDMHPKVYHYVDDFIIISATFEEHIETLTEVAERLKRAKLTVSQAKSKFCYKRVTFLGYVLSERGLEPNPERIMPIVNYKIPETVRDVRRLIGLINWYRRFIKFAAELLAPLNEMTKGKGKNSQHKIEWTSEAAESLERVKQILISEPVLRMADFDKPFKIYSDASLTAGSAILVQEENGVEHTVYYHSVKFTPTQQNYSATERELLSVLAGVEKFRPWIDGTPVEVVTDHASIKWLHNLKEPHGKLARWAVRLQAFDLRFTHRPGRDMELPDALSRAVNVVEMEQNVPSQDSWYNQIRQRAKTEKLSLYKFENGYLYRHASFNSHTGDRRWNLCVPKEKTAEVLREMHDEQTHVGVWKAMRLAKTKYYWPKMNRDIYQYVTKCEICRQCKTSNENVCAKTGNYREPGRIGRVLSIDLIGPLPASKRRRHQHAVVVVECASKYVFTKSFVNATAENIVTFLEEQIFESNWIPEQIICDNGPQFISEVFNKCLERRKITKVTTPYYHAQANPVEATNKTIKTALRTEILRRNAEHVDWAALLPYITSKINTTPHTATGKSPYYMVYGYDKVHSGDEYRVILDATPEFSNEKERRDMILEEAADARREQFENNRARYNLRAKTRTFKVGDEVYVRNKKQSSSGERYTQKLAPQKLPARIAEQIGQNTYMITDRNGASMGKWHANDLMFR